MGLDPEKLKAKYRRHNAKPERIAYNKARSARPDVKEKRRLCSARYQQFKRDLLAEFTCKACDSLDNTVIQWHHVDPSLKEFEIMSSLNACHDRWWNELLKCIPLCANCHIKIHKDLICLLPQKLPKNK